MSDTTTTQTSPDQTPTPPRKRHRVRNGLLILAALGTIGGIASAAGGSSHPAAASAPSATSQPATRAPATKAPATKAPAPAAPASSAPAQQAPAQQAPAAPAKPAPPAVTASQQQALDSAQSYLGLDSGFSRQGLIDQLDSPYGGKFSVADATWATDHSGADWDAQAVLAAKGYMNLGTGFSRSGLIDQLDSPYGGKFTLAQATYAANQVGL
jgi:Host cell surface-exposed lipoprotein